MTDMQRPTVLPNVGRQKVEANLDVALIVLFIWFKANGTLTISWWYIVLALFI